MSSALVLIKMYSDQIPRNIALERILSADDQLAGKQHHICRSNRHFGQNRCFISFFHIILPFLQEGSRAFSPSRLFGKEERRKHPNYSASTTGANAASSSS